MVLHPAVSSHHPRQMNWGPLHRLWGSQHSGSVEHRMGEICGQAEVLAPGVDLERAVDFVQKKGDVIVKVDIKPRVLPGGHFSKTIRDQIKDGSGHFLQFCHWQKSWAVPSSRCVLCGTGTSGSTHLWNCTHLEGDVWHRPFRGGSHYLQVRKGF